MWRIIQDHILEISLALILGAIAGASGNWMAIAAWTVLFALYCILRFKRSHTSRV
jgi:hypothetical protein